MGALLKFLLCNLLLRPVTLSLIQTLAKLQQTCNESVIIRHENALSIFVTIPRL